MSNTFCMRGKQTPLKALAEAQEEAGYSKSYASTQKRPKILAVFLRRQKW